MSKVIFITGASSGIGKAMALYLHEEGYKVYGTSRTPSKYSELPFPLLAMDVTDAQSIQKAIFELFEKEHQLDVLVNNAGMGITGPLEETPKEEIAKAFDTNFYGPLEVIKAVLPYMRKQKKGLIINITSIAGYMGLPYRGIYSATKAALEVASEAYRMEIKSFGIKMTCVAPGDFATNIAAGRYHAPVVKGSPYERPYSESLDTMNEHVDAGDDPKLMARAIHQIIEAPHPKVHYRVGSWLQKFSVVLKKHLPDKMYERMLLKHYKLK